MSRCPRTLAQDGAPAPVQYSTQDRFCLDGQRLVVVNGVAYAVAGHTVFVQGGLIQAARAGILLCPRSTCLSSDRFAGAMPVGGQSIWAR